MSGYNDYSDLFSAEERERQDGGGLRKQLEEALSEIRTLRNELNSEKRAKTLTDLFTEKGKDPAAAALVPEGADPKAWLDQYGAFIADAKKAEAKVEDQQEKQAAPEVPAPDPALDQERMAMETLQGLGLGLPGTGIPSTASADPIEKMKTFQTEEELMAYIRSNGAE